MANKQLEEVLFQVEQLYTDLDKVIAQERWGGANSYVGFYNRFLAQAKAVLPDLPLDPLPEVEQSRQRFPMNHAEQQDIDRQALLSLRPECGQLLAWLRRKAKA